MDKQVLFATVGAISGALITSLIAPYFLQSTARREARALALGKLMEVELSRWAGTSDLDDYRKRQTELRAALMIANGSKPIADNYAKMAAVARSFSDFDYEEQYESPESGVIPINISDVTNDAASLLSRSLWAPYILRPILRIKLRALLKEQMMVEASYEKDRRKHCWKGRII